MPVVRAALGGVEFECHAGVSRGRGGWTGYRDAYAPGLGSELKRASAAKGYVPYTRDEDQLCVDLEGKIITVAL